MEATLIKIELLRQSMENLGLAQGLSDPGVIALSQRLDNLLNEYHRLSLGQCSVA